MKLLPRYVIYSQSSLIIGLLLCFIIYPGLMLDPGGISNFALQLSTAIPYTLGFLLSAIFLMLLAKNYPKNLTQSYKVKLYLNSLAILLLLVLTSSYVFDVNEFFGWLHKIIGAILITFQIYFGWWLIVIFRLGFFVLFLLGLHVFGALVMLFSLFTALEILSLGQITIGLSFAGLLLLAFLNISQTGLNNK